MKKCVYCTEVIPTAAVSCVHCGKSLKEKKQRKRDTLILLVLILTSAACLLIPLVARLLLV